MYNPTRAYHGYTLCAPMADPFFSEDERFGHANRVFRAYRYGPDFPGLRGKALSPEEYNWFNHLYQQR